LGAPPKKLYNDKGVWKTLARHNGGSGFKISWMSQKAENNNFPRRPARIFACCLFSGGLFLKNDD